MKRFAPFITCFYLCSLFLPLSLRANVLPISETTVTGAAADDYYKSARAQLKVISNDKIGQTLIASEALSSTAALAGLVTGAAGLAGVAYYERTGKDPVYAAFNAVASAADALFVPAYQAFKANFISPESYPATASQYVGVEGSVGATLGNILNHVLDAAESLYPNFRNFIDPYVDKNLPSLPDSSTVVNGAVFIQNGVKYQITSSTWVQIASGSSSAKPTVPPEFSTFNVLSDDSYYVMQSNQLQRWYCWFNDSRWLWYWRSEYLNVVVAPDATPLTINPVGTETPHFDDIKDHIGQLSPAAADDVSKIIRDLPANQKITSNDPAPNSVPANGPSPITNNQVQNFFAQNTTNIYNQSLETITDNSTSTSTVTNDVAKAAAEAAKAQEEEAEKQTEETFNPISDSAFAEPYNPGEFDIPARFTTFLDNVKSSGLFSFSNNFFNSLPSGGSPIFEIEGGIFGSHSIDLSETMSGGLAIVKTVLLALFGFLSIRAVIMKR